MVSEFFEHIEDSWKHLISGNSTFGEKVECGVEAIAACLLLRGAVRSLGKPGIFRAVEEADVGMPKLLGAKNWAPSELTFEDTARLFDRLADTGGSYRFQPVPALNEIRPGIPGEIIENIDGHQITVGANQHVVERWLPDGKADRFTLDSASTASPVDKIQLAHPALHDTAYMVRPGYHPIVIPSPFGPQTLHSGGGLLAADGELQHFWVVSDQKLTSMYRPVGQDSESLYEDALKRLAEERKRLENQRLARAFGDVSPPDHPAGPVPDRNPDRTIRGENDSL